MTPSPVPCITVATSPSAATHTVHLSPRTVKETEEKAATDGGSPAIAEPASEVNVFSRAVFVNTRRGKGAGGKRKISGAAAVVDAAQVRSCRACGHIVVLLLPIKQTRCSSTQVNGEVVETDEPMETKPDAQTGTTDNQDGRKGDGTFEQSISCSWQHDQAQQHSGETQHL